MNLNYSDEQKMLRDGIARYIAKEYEFEKRASQLSDGDTLRHWQAFAEMGWLTVPFTERDGGISGSAIDTAIVMEEFGRGLVIEPFLANTVLAGHLLAAYGTDAQRSATLEPLMSGELRLAVAHAEPDSRHALNSVSTSAEKIAGGFRVSGHKAVVLGGDVADQVVVAARTAGGVNDASGITLLLVDTAAEGVERQRYQTVDGQGAAELILEGVEIPEDCVVGEVGRGLHPLGEAVDRAALAVCAEAVGAMQSALTTTLDYAKERKQFGVPIASFQALQHRMVEMLIEIEQSRSIVLRACLLLDKGDPQARSAIPAAKVRTGRAAKQVGEEAVQMHGGIGIAEEYCIGHYLKRLTAIRYTFGSESYHKRRYMSAA